MAIYRPPKPRWPLAVAAALGGFIVGFIAGLVIGSRDPELTESVPLIQSQLVAAASALEIVSIEYEESVEDGEVVRQAEYEGAVAALDSSRSKYTAVRPALQSLFPDPVSSIDSLYDEVEALIREQAPSTDVAESLTKLEALLNPP